MNTASRALPSTSRAVVYIIILIGSAGSDHIEIMKKLANAQDCLNTYVTQHKPGYAWEKELKKAKGADEIQLKPKLILPSIH